MSEQIEGRNAVTGGISLKNVWDAFCSGDVEMDFSTHHYP